LIESNSGFRHDGANVVDIHERKQKLGSLSYAYAVLVPTKFSKYFDKRVRMNEEIDVSRKQVTGSWNVCVQE
jgi:hypothetical protein